MSLHRALEDNGLLHYTISTVDRMVGFYIFMRSGALILLMYSALLGIAGISYWWTFVLLSLVALFVGVLADYYAMVHIIRGLSGSILLNSGRFPECESFEKLVVLSLKSILSTEE